MTVDKLLRAVFRNVFWSLLGGEGPDEEGAWERFLQSEQAARALEQAARAAGVLVPGVPGAEMARRLRPVWDAVWEWAVKELADAVLFEPGSGLRSWLEPRADGTLERWFGPSGAPPPDRPTGRPQEN